MVAIIKTGQSIRRILNYNELKVKAGVAEVLAAINYPIDADKLSFSAKLNRFEKQMELNKNVKRNSVHISLNFDVSEGTLAREKLQAIAEDYMSKIGFGKQPYLVYQHYDAAHPHIHIVTTNIEADGKRIDLHHLGIKKSEPARKAIEKGFNLVVAENQKKRKIFQVKPVAVSKAAYGKSETKSAIQHVLEAVVGQYKYTSLSELNAVLRQYNVVADSGSDGSRVKKNQGLLYRVLDADGKAVGVPIKASSFYSKPTLKFLEQQFKESDTRRKPYQGRVKNAIDKALLGRAVSLPQLINLFEKQGIATVLRLSDSGLVYGITYVDHQTKSVFNGSDLGKEYSAKGLQERCAPASNLQTDISKYQRIPNAAGTASKGEVLATDKASSVPGIIDSLLQLEQTHDSVPGQLMKKKKKKRGIKNSR